MPFELIFSPKLNILIISSMGLAPLTIVQETIIVQFFQGKGLGFALAVGLTLGRLVSLAVI